MPTKANHTILFLALSSGLLLAESITENTEPTCSSALFIKDMKHNAAGNTLAHPQNGLRATIHSYADTLKQGVIENTQLAKNAVMIPLNLSLSIFHIWLVKNHDENGKYLEQHLSRIETSSIFLNPFLHTAFGNWITQMGPWWGKDLVFITLKYAIVFGYDRQPITTLNLIAAVLTPMVLLVHTALPDLFYSASLAGLEGIKTLTAPTNEPS